MGLFNMFFKRKTDESTVEYLDRVGNSVKADGDEASRIDEAEVYLAYGRFNQGMETLNEILRDNPNDEKALALKAQYSGHKPDESTLKFQSPISASLKEEKKSRKYLVSVLANVEGNTFPHNFEIITSLDVKDSKVGQDFLKDKINAQGYDSWGLLSVIELKE